MEQKKTIEMFFDLGGLEFDRTSLDALMDGLEGVDREKQKFHNNCQMLVGFYVSILKDKPLLKRHQPLLDIKDVMVPTKKQIQRALSYATRLELRAKNVDDPFNHFEK